MKATLRAKRSSLAMISFATLKATGLEGVCQFWPVRALPTLDLGELGDELPTPAIKVLADGLPLGLQAKLGGIEQKGEGEAGFRSDREAGFVLATLRDAASFNTWPIRTSLNFIPCRCLFTSQLVTGNAHIEKVMLPSSLN